MTVVAMVSSESIHTPKFLTTETGSTYNLGTGVYASAASRKLAETSGGTKVNAHDLGLLALS